MGSGIFDDLINDEAAHDFSRYIIAWKLCTTMTAEDVTTTLDLALKASGLDQAKVIHRPRLLSDNGIDRVSERRGLGD